MRSKLFTGKLAVVSHEGAWLKLFGLTEPAFSARFSLDFCECKKERAAFFSFDPAANLR
jgi:hypothetical protein